MSSSQASHSIEGSQIVQARAANSGEPPIQSQDPRGFFANFEPVGDTNSGNESNRVGNGHDGHDMPHTRRNPTVNESVVQFTGSRLAHESHPVALNPGAD